MTTLVHRTEIMRRHCAGEIADAAYAALTDAEKNALADLVAMKHDAYFHGENIKLEAEKRRRVEQDIRKLEREFADGTIARRARAAVAK